MLKDRKAIKQKLIIVLIVTFFVASNFYGNIFDVVLAADDVEETQDKIDSIEKKLKKEQAELNMDKSNYSKVTAQVGTTKNLLNQTATEISRKEAEIANMNDQIILYKKMLTAHMQELYFSDSSDEMLRLTLNDGSLYDIFSIEEQHLSVKEKIMAMMQEITSSQNKLAQIKDELADKKEEHEKILQQKKIEQNEIASDIQESQATIAELQNKLDNLRSALSSFLGKSYDAKDVDDAVRFASKATGIRKEYLQAELIVETGYGTFTGGCTYKNIRMKKADVNEFLKLAKELEKAYGSDYKNKKLSCSPKWGGYGGAMGVAQFMPTTWIGYKDKISSRTGHNPPDPWNLTDGIVGMAVKLANAGATSKKGEFEASKRYYCGGPGSAFWNNKCNDYAKKVQYFSKDPESHI
jgi:peptidoglycan hydrolase CwlO-like protein